MKTKLFSALFLTLLLATTSVVAQQQTQVQSTPDLNRLQQHISYLASDALQGRRTGTPGANDAAHYIAGEFSRLGLRPAFQKAGASRRLSVAMSQYLQQFPYVAGVTLGSSNMLSLGDKKFSVGKDWMPLGFSSNSRIE